MKKILLVSAALVSLAAQAQTFPDKSIVPAICGWSKVVRAAKIKAD